jgi:hypothetical protein
VLRVLEQRQAGEVVTLTVWRGGQVRRQAVTLAAAQ